MTTTRPDAMTELIADLRRRIGGEVIAPGDEGYDDARRVWNGVIDRYPAVVARCADTADVVTAVELARHHRIEVAIRGGGHQVAGTGVCDDGLVIDLSLMNQVEVDPESRTARVGAGARWADVDGATQVHGLMTPGGEVSTTGVAGLTLGGGMGLVQRAFGLACDSLRSVEIVTADGVVRQASAVEHPDLFWAARGAGRGIGVVTAFEFDLHPLGPEVACAQVVYGMDEATSVLRNFRDAARSAPESVSPQLVLWSVPPDPEIPEALHGQPMIMAIALFAGDPGAADAVLAPYAALGTPLLDLTDRVAYTGVQSSVDELLPAGGRYYFKAHFANELTDEALGVIQRFGESRPTPGSLIAVRTLGGAIDQVGPDESAYPHRGAGFNVSFDAAWTARSDDDRAIGWARDGFTSFTPHATGGVYMNFAGFEGEEDVTAAAAFGDDPRLAEVRDAYDPGGVFAAAASRY